VLVDNFKTVMVMEGFVKLPPKLMQGLLIRANQRYFNKK